MHIKCTLLLIFFSSLNCAMFHEDLRYGNSPEYKLAFQTVFNAIWGNKDQELAISTLQMFPQLSQEVFRMSESRYRDNFLSITAGLGQEKVVQKPLALNAPLGIVSKDQSGIPLTDAVRGGHVNVCRMLINAGAGINERLSNDSPTALWHAAKRGNSTLIRMLLEAGAEAQLADHMNSTPLHESTLSDRLEDVLLLLDAGADPDAQTVDGDTPLLYATENNNRLMQERFKQVKSKIKIA